jgi:hypothetical protein
VTFFGDTRTVVLGVRVPGCLLDRYVVVQVTDLESFRTGPAYQFNGCDHRVLVQVHPRRDHSISLASRC